MYAAYERIAASGHASIDLEVRRGAARLLIECAPHAPNCADAALDVLSNMMQEDDETIEIYFLMGVAFFNQEPPDLVLADEYLGKASEMLDRVRAALAADGSEEFPYESQAHLLEEQRALIEEYRRAHPKEAAAEEDEGSDEAGEMED
jgi:hypothetical protein